MPQIGEIKHGRDIGKGTQANKYTWQPCEVCGKERWVPFVVNTSGKHYPLCRNCWFKKVKFRKGESHPNWKGGRHFTAGGYIRVRIYPGNFFYPMATIKGFVLEHRLVMAKHLGRCLLSWEVVHHKGTKYPQGSIENKSDNRIENLELLPYLKFHLVDVCTRSHIRKLEKENERLRLKIQQYAEKQN